VRRSILVVAPYIPLPATFGGALRTYHFIRQLARNHDVSLLAPGRESDIPAALELGDLCNVTLVPAISTARQPASTAKRLGQIRALTSGRPFLEVSGYHPQMQSAMDRLFMTRQIDLVQYEFPESALYKPPPHVPTLFDAHNIEHDLLARVARSGGNASKQIFNLLESHKLKRLETALWDQATSCIATSERDANLMRGLTSTPVDVVPNGVDLEYFGEAPHIPPQAHHVVFTGAMRHQPNADGAVWYATKVHPLVRDALPDATFSIAGADPPRKVQALESSSIEVTGEVADIRPFIGGAQVMIVPLWSGGGTRLKVLEAFAAGRPVVSTTVGVEGLDVQHGEHLLIAATAVDFAKAVIKLCADRELAERLSSAGRQLVEDRYGWSAIAARLEEAHGRILAEPKT
jgi:polysaccharide biosynthesis protein PslH